MLSCEIGQQVPEDLALSATDLPHAERSWSIVPWLGVDSLGDHCLGLVNL